MEALAQDSAAAPAAGTETVHIVEIEPRTYYAGRSQNLGNSVTYTPWRAQSLSQESALTQASRMRGEGYPYVRVLRMTVSYKVEPV